MKHFLFFVALSASPAFAAHPISIDVDEPGLYPAGSSVYIQSEIPALIQGELDRQCGLGKSVSDLNIQVQLIHNEVPGTAEIKINGTASCR
jgi:hypothetical protein